MTHGQLLDRSLALGKINQSDLALQLLDRKLRTLWDCHAVYHNYTPAVRELADVLSTMGSRRLLELLATQLPLPSIKSTRRLAPPPVLSGTMPAHFRAFLLLCHNAGPVVGSTGVPVDVASDGKAVQYHVALAMDGLQIAPGVAYLQGLDTITGFTVPVTDDLLTSIYNLEDIGAVRAFEREKDIFVCNVQVGVITRADGACRSVLYTKYTGRKSAAAHCHERINDMLALTQVCAGCISEEGTVGQCHRPQCPACSGSAPCAVCRARPCQSCLDAGRICVSARVVSLSTDCASGESGGFLLWRR